MLQYLNLLQYILNYGRLKEDRTGTGTKSIFGYMMRFDLTTGYPILTTKKVHFKSVAYELLWFLKGETNIKYLNDHKVRIWNEWADEKGDLGPVYGKQWRNWEGADGKIYDQISDVIHRIKTNPSDRRMIVSAWKVDELHKMALPPCHLLFQFYVVDDKLSCQMYQRSCDTFLGVPFNIASYALLTTMVAQQCNLTAHEFIWVGGDVHLYSNHLEAAKIQITRTPYPLPILTIKKCPPSIFDYEYEDFALVNYQHHPGIQAGISI